ncbi:MAG: FAD-binding protein, partial [Dehalococcoidia bacterium]
KGFGLRIETPPFCAVSPVWCGLNATSGGPKINRDCQVVDRDEVPLPGLYAAGEMVGGILYGKHLSTPGGGSTPHLDDGICALGDRHEYNPRPFGRCPCCEGAIASHLA